MAVLIACGVVAIYILYRLFFCGTNERFQDFIPKLTRRYPPDYFVQLFAAIQQNKSFVQNRGMRQVSKLLVRAAKLQKSQESQFRAQPVTQYLESQTLRPLRRGQGSTTQSQTVQIPPPPADTPETRAFYLQLDIFAFWNLVQNVLIFGNDLLRNIQSDTDQLLTQTQRDAVFGSAAFRQIGSMQGQLAQTFFLPEMPAKTYDIEHSVELQVALQTPYQTAFNDACLLAAAFLNANLFYSKQIAVLRHMVTVQDYGKKINEKITRRVQKIVAANTPPAPKLQKSSISATKINVEYSPEESRFVTQRIAQLNLAYSLVTQYGRYLFLQLSKVITQQPNSLKVALFQSGEMQQLYLFFFFNQIVPYAIPDETYYRVARSNSAELDVTNVLKPFSALAP